MFRLACRQTEGLIGSVLHLLGLTRAAPDHTTLCRRPETLEVPPPRLSPGAEPTHLLVDSTGLKPGGAGEWRVETHATRRRRSWRKRHIGMDADTGRIVAAVLTTNEVDDGSQLGPLADQVVGPVASFTGDGADDQEGVYSSVATRHPDAAVIVPPRRDGVLSDTAAMTPSQRDRHLQFIAAPGRIGWQKASDYNRRARVEPAIGRDKQVIGDGLHARTDHRRATEVAVAVHVLNRMLGIEPHAGFRPPDPCPQRLNPEGGGLTAPVSPICATRRRWPRHDRRLAHGFGVGASPNRQDVGQQSGHCVARLLTSAVIQSRAIQLNVALARSGGGR